MLDSWGNHCKLFTITHLNIYGKVPCCVSWVREVDEECRLRHKGKCENFHRHLVTKTPPHNVGMRFFRDKDCHMAWSWSERRNKDTSKGDLML